MFSGEVVTPPTHLPITVEDAQVALARAVVEEVERTVLWRGIVRQERRILIDGALPELIEIEPATTILSLTRWTATDAAAVVEAGDYDVVIRDPTGTILSPVPGYPWPSPARDIGSFTLTYVCGWPVTPESSVGAGDAVNEVPASVQLMIERAVAFRSGAGLGDLRIGSLDLSVAASYSTDQLPREIASIGRAYAYRPGIISARP